MKRAWDCKIGEVEVTRLPPAADLPMRKAVRAAYRALVGEDPIAIFSGWGPQFNEEERAVIENRYPDPDKVSSVPLHAHEAALAAARLQGWREGRDAALSRLRDVASRARRRERDALGLAIRAIRIYPEPDYSEEGDQ